MTAKKTQRLALGQVMVAIAEWLETLDLDIEPQDFSVNYDSHLQRIDVATVTPEGRIDRWLCGFSVDPERLDQYGQPVSLPYRIDGPAH